MSSCHFYRERMLHIRARPNPSGLARRCDSIRATAYGISFENEGQGRRRRRRRRQNGVLRRRFRYRILHSRVFRSFL